MSREVDVRFCESREVRSLPATHLLSGRYDHRLPVGGVPRDDRWFTRLHGDDELDVWLISWVPDCSTELHDHAAHSAR